MLRNILLIEPNYKNKYPPIGLMKIATYHRMLGDNVQFFKGDLRDLVVNELYEECILRLLAIDSSYSWSYKSVLIKKAIKSGRVELIKKLISYSNFDILIEECINEFVLCFRKKNYLQFPKWDRIYVTTLFTFYWKITVETILFAKKLVKSPDEIYIGGVLASLLHNELYQETGIKPMQGLLDKPGLLDENDIIIDNLPLDYSILDEIEYVYPTQSAYFTFMTKGCTRKCAFCSVPILEPTYKPKIDTIEKFRIINETFGEQRNLLLMDNNVLASPNFPEIIQEIKDMGFIKGATYIEPNQLEIVVQNLKTCFNDRANLKKAYRLLHESLTRHRNEKKQHFYDVLEKYDLIKQETVSKNGILWAYEEIKDSYDKYRNKAPKLRYVDFNQGTDARYVTDEFMRLMSEIPIRPLRIAFDYIGLKKQYVSAIELAAKYSIKELSNYILYNFKDKPEDLYNRLLINIQLCKRLDIAIFSFPMKYIPLFGEDAKHREFTGDHWNKKFIRAVQSILNVTKGIVAPGNINEKSSFFEQMFGSSIDDFFEILYMPETYIVYRNLFQHKLEYTAIWRNEFNSLLNEIELVEAKKIIEGNVFTNIDELTSNQTIKHFLRHYTIQRGQISQEDYEYVQLKRKYDKLIRTERYLDLTLTYDFE